MRRTVGFLLLGLAGFLVTAALLALLYVPGQVAKTPLDVNTTTRLTGNATVLPTGEGSAVRAISRSVADGEVSDDEVIVFDTFSCLMRDVSDTPDCTEDDTQGSPLVTAGTDRFATDRKTALAINDEAYVGALAEPHDGLVNKFPFDVQQETYPFWDGLVGRAVDAEFQAEEEIDGLPVYRFLISLTDEPAEISKGISGVYSTEKTMWIDQGTGSIIDQSEAQVRQLDDGTTVLDLELSFTDETVAANVEDAKANNAQLNLVRLAPIVLGLLGLLALGAGLFLALGESRAPRGRSSARDVSLEELTTSRRGR